MIVKSLELKDFRNYKELHMEFSPHTNILYGDNAQGKTNILEALYVSGISKSHKNSRDRDMIRFGRDEAHIRTVIEKNGMENQIDIHLKKNHAKGIAVNKIPIKKASELFGILNVVFFSPEDLNIIKNGPALKRRFMDMELCQIDKVYLSDLANYNKVLNQRNRLLKDLDFRPELKSTLPVWNQQLVLYGSKIIRRRETFIEELQEIISEIHSSLTGGKESLVLQYEKNTDPDVFSRQLEKNEGQDMRLHTTSVGPHRDDIIFFTNDVDIRKFGSQGQQRSAALSLKLAEIRLQKRVIHDTPVLLLDDVLSELDSSRQNYLLQRIHDIQTVITCTGLDEFVKNRFRIDRTFMVREGTVTEL